MLRGVSNDNVFSTYNYSIDSAHTRTCAQIGLWPVTHVYLAKLLRSFPFKNVRVNKKYTSLTTQTNHASLTLRVVVKF